MPSFDLYKKLNNATTSGAAIKQQSDMVIESTWDNSLEARICYFFDYYHDNNKTILDNIQPDKDMIPMCIKYLTNSSQTYSKDSITYHIQLKPSQEEVVSYYNEVFAKRYSAHYPCGLYVLIPDNKGIYNKWLVVGEANYNDPQFSTFEVLRCNKTIQYIFKGTKYNISAVIRSQNSYNSGIWSDRVTTIVEDQEKFVLPMNRTTEQLYYNQRIILDNAVLTEPRTWQISKIDRITSNGLAVFTCAQNMFDEHKDYIELDKYGNVIGMWADYFDSSIIPEEYDEKSIISNIHSKITYSGIKPQIKVGGSYKTFTVTFYDKEKEIPYREGNWNFTINGNDASSLLKMSNDKINENQVKFKFIGDGTYIGKNLIVKFTSTELVESDINIEIVGL